MAAIERGGVCQATISINWITCSGRRQDLPLSAYLAFARMPTHSPIPNNYPLNAKNHHTHPLQSQNLRTDVPSSQDRLSGLFSVTCLRNTLRSAVVSGFVRCQPLTKHARCSRQKP